MMPEISETHLSGLLLIKPVVFRDPRGYFIESFNKANFESAGIRDNFVQDNRSLSAIGTLRGLHFQTPPYTQAKLIQVISGKVLDVVVDIRNNSETYGQHYSVIISSDNFIQLYVPEGFAHGFLTLENDTIFSYKCANYYNKSSENGLMWNDPLLAINWGINNPVLSDKDKNFIGFDKFISPF